MGPVQSPAAVTIPLQKHSKQPNHTKSNRTHTNTNKQKTSTKTHNRVESDRRSSSVTIDEGRGDSIVSTQVLVWQETRAKRERTNTNITLPYRRVSEATQHYAETRDPPSQDPRDHIGASHQGMTTHINRNITSMLATTTPCSN